VEPSLNPCVIIIVLFFSSSQLVLFPQTPARCLLACFVCLPVHRNERCDGRYNLADWLGGVGGRRLFGLIPVVIVV